MKAMKLLTAAFLAFMPLAALACEKGHEQASSCAIGFVWDSETGTCVEITSS